MRPGERGSYGREIRREGGSLGEEDTWGRGKLASLHKIINTEVSKINFTYDPRTEPFIEIKSTTVTVEVSSVLEC